ncbi:hypothetical protein [Streptomyces sp. NPDC005046]
MSDLHAALHELSTATAAFWQYLSSSETIPPGTKETFEQASRRVKSLTGLVLGDGIRQEVDDANDTVGLLGLGEPSRYGMPTSSVPQALSKIGRAEHAVAEGVRKVYKSGE